jgi:hypothetical protein
VTYNATDDEFAQFMCGNLDILRAHGMAVRAVPTPFTAGRPPAAEKRQSHDNPLSSSGPAPSPASHTALSPAAVTAVAGAFSSEDSQ